jgi:hypothetical protein
MISYNVSFSDSIFTFDEDITFNEDAIFRGQHLNMTLYIPYDFPFTMDEGTSRFIAQYVDSEYLEGYTWKMTRKGLECIDCNEAADESLSELRDFDEVEISGKFDLRILQGNNYAVELNGPDQAKRQYSVRRSGETLVIDFERNEDINWDDFDLRRLPVEEMEIVVTMPSLERLEAMGLGSVQFEDLTGERLEVEVRGPVKVRGDMNVGEVTIRLTGKSEADLSGTAGSMTARVRLRQKSTLKALLKWKRGWQVTLITAAIPG